MHIRACVVLFVCGFLACAPVSAQVRIAGTVSGTVTDSAGLVVPGASAQLMDGRPGSPSGPSSGPRRQTT